MTFYYDEGADELVGNNLFYESDDRGPYASREGPELHIDVTEIMETGRGVGKLREMRDAIDTAIETHEEDS